ncbi:hypothetical protein EYC80_006754 [Monilinia laxa]|uniref:Uncharacterized protein n=1 Tax=Monilinia laxa TaxID=61186 RepID=A0A5N6JZ49_MONLA|nr:hypothetical protein EYC80_006754 [Monilinia laxa]
MAKRLILPLAILFWVAILISNFSPFRYGRQIYNQAKDNTLLRVPIAHPSKKDSKITGQSLLNLGSGHFDTLHTSRNTIPPALLQLTTHCSAPVNKFTNHLRLPNLLYNISMMPRNGPPEKRTFWNPTIISLPYWAKNQYLIVSMVYLKERGYRANVLCEANICHPRTGNLGSLHERICTSEDLEILGSNGGLRCESSPVEMNVPPTPAESCQGDQEKLADVSGFHDPRIFYSGRGEPVLMLSSQYASSFIAPNANEIPCLIDATLEEIASNKYMANAVWHQTTPALKLILCTRFNATCISKTPDTVFIAAIHRKHKNILGLPIRYERYIVMWAATSPFNMLAISQHPILFANETTTGWTAKESWDDVPEALSEGRDFWAKLTYTTTIAYAWNKEDGDLRDKGAGYLDDEIILSVGVDDHDQVYGKVLVSELLQYIPIRDNYPQPKTFTMPSQRLNKKVSSPNTSLISGSKVPPVKVTKKTSSSYPKRTRFSKRKQEQKSSSNPQKINPNLPPSQIPNPHVSGIYSQHTQQFSALDRRPHVNLESEPPITPKHQERETSKSHRKRVHFQSCKDKSASADGFPIDAEKGVETLHEDLSQPVVETIQKEANFVHPCPELTALLDVLRDQEERLTFHGARLELANDWIPEEYRRITHLLQHGTIATYFGCCKHNPPSPIWTKIADENTPDEDYRLSCRLCDHSFMSPDGRICTQCTTEPVLEKIGEKREFGITLKNYLERYGLSKDWMYCYFWQKESDGTLVEMYMKLPNERKIILERLLRLSQRSGSEGLESIQ